MPAKAHKPFGSFRLASARFLLIAAFALGAFAFAGCGGNDNTDDTSSLEKPALTIPDASVNASSKSSSGSTSATGSTASSDTSGSGDSSGTDTGGAGTDTGAGTGGDTGGQNTGGDNGGGGGGQQNTGGAVPGQ